uniref:Uncharacterized protein n=1 Tax=Anguilla anguilla TaxID=7936 RepID=A0A0E9TR71_ANGAN
MRSKKDGVILGKIILEWLHLVVKARYPELKLGYPPFLCMLWILENHFVCF